MTIQVIMKLDYILNTSKKITLATWLTAMLSMSVFFAHAEVDKGKWTEGKNLFKGKPCLFNIYCLMRSGCTNTLEPTVFVLSRLLFYPDFKGML